MGWLKNNIRSIAHSFLTSNDAEIWTPKRGYRTISKKGIVSLAFALPTLFIGAYYGSKMLNAHEHRSSIYPPTPIHSTANTKVEPFQPQFVKVQIPSPIDDELDISFDTNMRSQMEQAVIEDVQQEEIRRDVIRADLLQKTGTTLPKTNILSYTENGIKVPDSNYVLVVNGKKISPNKDLFIQISPELRNKFSGTIRLAKVDDSGNYVASFKTKIEGKETKNKNIYAIQQLTSVADVIPLGSLPYIHQSLKSDSTKTNKLERIFVKKPTANDSIPESSSLENAVQSVQSTHISFAPLPDNYYENSMKTYAEKRYNPKSTIDTVIEGLSRGYQIDKVADSAKTKDGFRVSNTSVVKSLMYGKNKDQTFGNYVLQLKGFGLSNKKIAEIMRQETKDHFTNGEGININANQVRDSLESYGQFSSQDRVNRYRVENPNKYETLDKIKIYNK